jgi:hypothetical protein
MQSVSNNVTTPQTGLISTNPFLKANLNVPSTTGAKPVIPTFGASSQPTGANGNPYAPNTTLPGTQGNSGSTTSGIIPLPNVSSSGVTQPQSNGLGISSTIPSQTTAYTLNGINYDASGAPIPSNTPAKTSGNTGGGNSNNTGSNTPNPANIQSQINTDQSAVSALQAQLAAQNTYSGGVNSNGQTLPGYVSPSQLGSAISTLGSTASSPTQPYTNNQNNSQSDQAGLVSNSGITPTEQGIINSEKGLASQYGLANMNESSFEPGLTIGESQGQQGALLNAYNSELQSYQNAYTQAQTQQQTQLGALNSAGGLANTAASNATSQQGTQQSGQGAVVNALTPQQQYGALVNPATGQPISSSALVSGASSLPATAQSALSALPQSAQSAIMLEAQKVQNNQETAQQAQSNLSAYGQAGTTALNAILGPNFNANTNAGASSAQQSNTQTAGTASTSANQQIYQQQLSAAATTLQQAQAIQLSGNQLLSTMSSLGISPNQANIANQTINQLASQYSSPAYATFNANIANLQSKVSSLLSSGEIPTGATAAANSIINGSMNIAGLSAAITQINTEASQLAQSQLSTAQSAYQNIQNGSGNSGSSGGWASLGD